MTREEHISNLETIGCDGWTVTTDAYKSLQFAIQVLEQESCPNAISRSDMLDAIGHGVSYTSEELQKIIKALPPVNPLAKDYNTIYYTPQPKTGHCVWCSSPYRIEYYWIDREGNTASYQDEDRHIVATGIAKYCPNCGARIIEPQESEESDADSD